MSNEIKVGSRVVGAAPRSLHGVVRHIENLSESCPAAAVRWDNGFFNTVMLCDLTLIPDIVTIELSRESAQHFGRQWVGGDRHFEGLIQACRKALGMEDA